MVQTIDVDKIRIGWHALDDQGQQIGEVVEVGSNYVLVVKGLFLPTDLYIPLSRVAILDEEESNFIVSVTKDEVASMGWQHPPADGSWGAPDARDSLDVQKRIEPTPGGKAIGPRRPGARPGSSAGGGSRTAAVRAPDTAHMEATSRTDQTMRERGKLFEHAVREGMVVQGIATMRELAEVTGTPPTTWNWWFKGYQPRRSSLMRIAHALDLTVEELMGPWENGPRMVMLTDDRLRALVRDAVAEGVEEAIRRVGAVGPREIAS